MLAWNVFFLHSGACESTCACLFQCGVHFPCLCSVEENCALWQIHHHALKWIDIIDLIYPSLLIPMLALPFSVCKGILLISHLPSTSISHRKIKCLSVFLSYVQSKWKMLPFMLCLNEVKDVFYKKKKK